MGKLIVFEGTDGSGKATQTAMLYERLKNEGVNLRKLDFPRYSEASSALIKMYLNGDFGDKPGDVNPYAASTFFAVDRYASYKQDWGKFYEDGGLIVSDRYTTSNAIHQSVKLQENEKVDFLTWLYSYEFGLLRLPKPNLVFYLDVPTEITEKMMRKREAATNTHADIHEKDTEYLKKCRDSANTVINFCGWERIDCSENGEMRSIESIHEEIYRKVTEWLKEENTK